MPINVLQRLPQDCPIDWRVSVSGEGRRTKYSCGFAGKERNGVCTGCPLASSRLAGERLPRDQSSKSWRIRAPSGRTIP